MTVHAVLFDVDGTLVDSTFLHVDAWQRALADLDVDADAWRIHRAIGQDSARLLRAVAGDRETDWVARAKEAHARRFREEADRLRAFDGAAELLRAVAARGIRAVLATSASTEELTLLRHAINADDAVHAVTSADDVEAAKPDPGILSVALERADVTASEALMVGDAVWDMVAAARAGVRSVGVRSGGLAEAELRDAGASDVFDDAAALLAALDRVI